MDTRPASRRQAFGLAIRRLEYNHTYTFELWRQFLRLAKEQGTMVFLFQGRAPGLDTEGGRTDTALYRLIHASLVDGLALSPMVTGHLAAQDWDQFRQQIPLKNVVTLAIGTPALSGIEVDDAAGLVALMRHLIHDHGCRRIAHIRGPVPHPQAVLRERVWRHELLRAGIIPQDSWIIQGHFDSEKISTIATDLIHQTGGNIDAVVACNDSAAMRLLEDLPPLGFRIPDDIRVCGYDDTPRCQRSQPPLTTVTQCIDDQARGAWNLMTRGTGEAGPEHRKVETQLVVRGSCGCRPADWSPQAFADLESQRDAAQKDPRFQNLLRWRDSPVEATIALVEKGQALYRQNLYRMSQFVGEMNRMHTDAGLGSLLETWLPQMGIGTFALFRTCRADSTIVPFEQAPSSGTQLPASPDYFCLQASLPASEHRSAVPSLDLGNHRWFASLDALGLGVFPLSRGGLWFGLVFLELGDQDGLFCLAIQEQVQSFLDRLERERVYIEETAKERAKAQIEEERMETLARLVAVLAHEINTPLGAISSCNRSLARDLLEYSLRSPDFYCQLSGLGKSLHKHLLDVLSRPRPALGSRETRVQRKLWLDALARVPCTDSPKTADELIVLGLTPATFPVQELTAAPEWQAVVEELAQLSDVLRASGVIAEATEKATRYVVELRRGTAV